MKRKPTTCEGCPLYRDGWGWVPDKIVEGSEVLVVSIFPTTYETRTGIPRAGSVIENHEGKYERYAGPVERSYAHLVRCRGQKGTALPKGRALKDGVAYCRQYDNIPDSTKLIVLNGIDVGKQLRPDVGVTQVIKWRGFVYPEVTDETDS